MWIVVMARDMYGPMTGASAWMMTANWDVPHLVLLWAMWTVMMTGMMLPIRLTSGAAVRRHRATIRSGNGRAPDLRAHSRLSRRLDRVQPRGNRASAWTCGAPALSHR